MLNCVNSMGPQGSMPQESSALIEERDHQPVMESCEEEYDYNHLWFLTFVAFWLIQFVIVSTSTFSLDFVAFLVEKFSTILLNTNEASFLTAYSTFLMTLQSPNPSYSLSILMKI